MHYMKMIELGATPQKNVMLGYAASRHAINAVHISERETLPRVSLFIY
jgi:hypothetical protein